MPRLVATSTKPYRTFLLELHDGGGSDCTVIIHPPQGRGAAREVLQSPGQPTTLGALIVQAKALVDAAMGPKRPPQLHRPMRRFAPPSDR